MDYESGESTEEDDVVGAGSGESETQRDCRLTERR